MIIQKYYHNEIGKKEGKKKGKGTDILYLLIKQWEMF